MASIALHNLCIEKNDPCQPRWRLEVKKLNLIRSRGIQRETTREIRQLVMGYMPTKTANNLTNLQ